jgi:hypothetical protein
MLKVYKIDQNRLEVIAYTHLRPLRMSGAQVFSNAHDTAVSGGTVLYSWYREWNSYILAQQADCVDLWQMHIHNINNSDRTTSDAVIPLMPNPSNRFTGCTEVIAKLKKYFSTNANDTVQKRRFFLLHGMGGIGKTQICLKFTEEMSDW